MVSALLDKRRYGDWMTSRTSQIRSHISGYQHMPPNCRRYLYRRVSPDS